MRLILLALFVVDPVVCVFQTISEILTPPQKETSHLLGNTVLVSLHTPMKVMSEVKGMSDVVMICSTQSHCPSTYRVIIKAVVLPYY